LRILFIAGAYLPYVGGIEVLLHGLTAEYRRRGHTTTVLCSAVTPGEEGVSDVDGIRVVRVAVPQAMAARSPLRMLHARRAIRETTATLEPDVVHAHDIGPVLWLYRQAATTSRPPLIVTIHTVVSKIFADAPEALANQVLAADWVTGVSQSVADDIVGYAPGVASRLSVISNGVVPPAGPVTPVPMKPPRLLYVGRLIDLKNVDLAIAATARLMNRYPTLRLTIAGVGPSELALRELAAELGIAAQVDFVGLVEREQVPQLLRSASVVVMPSAFEGLPLVALEAAWAGRPVVGSWSVGVLDAVIDGETGCLVDPGDVDALTNALGDLLADPVRARALGVAARARAEREFSLEQCADRYEALYERVIAQSP
jgi:glycogen(starch) synthase